MLPFLAHMSIVIVHLYACWNTESISFRVRLCVGTTHHRSPDNCSVQCEVYLRCVSSRATSVSWAESLIQMLNYDSICATFCLQSNGAFLAVFIRVLLLSAGAIYMTILGTLSGSSIPPQFVQSGDEGKKGSVEGKHITSAIARRRFKPKYPLRVKK